MSQPTTPLRSASSQSLQGAPQANEGFRRSNRLNRNPDNPSDASPEPRDAQQLAPTSKERRTNQSRKHEVIDLTGDDVDHDLEEAVGSAKDKPATEANAGNKVQLSPIWNPELGLGADTILCAAAGEQRIQGPLINCSVCRNACDGKFCVAKRCGCIQCLENCGPRSARQAIPCLEHAHLYTDDGYFHDARRPVVVFCDDMCPITMDYFEKPMASKGCGHVFSSQRLREWIDHCVKTEFEGSVRWWIVPDVPIPHAQLMDAARDMARLMAPCPVCKKEMGDLVYVGSWWDEGEGEGDDQLQGGEDGARGRRPRGLWG